MGCVALLPSWVVVLAQTPVTRHSHIFYDGLCMMKVPLILRARV